MNRRSFLTSILALGAAPAIVRAESIMRVRAIVLPGDEEYKIWRLQPFPLGTPGTFEYGKTESMNLGWKLIMHSERP